MKIGDKVTVDVGYYRGATGTITRFFWFPTGSSVVVKLDIDTFLGSNETTYRACDVTPLDTEQETK